MFFGTGHSNMALIFFWAFLNAFSVNNESQGFNFFPLQFTFFLVLGITQPVLNKSIFFAYAEHGAPVYQNKSKYCRGKLPLFYPNMLLKHC